MYRILYGDYGTGTVGYGDYGTGMDMVLYVYVCGMVLAWILYGTCIDTVWYVYGYGMVRVWIWYGMCMDMVRVWVWIWYVYGYGIIRVWIRILYGKALKTLEVHYLKHGEYGIR